MTDSQTLGLLRVEVVPMAAFRERLSGWWQVGGAHGSRATQETTFGCVGDGDRRPAALLLQHCFSCKNDNCTEIHLLFIVTVSAGNRKPVAFITWKQPNFYLKPNFSTLVLTGEAIGWPWRLLQIPNLKTTQTGTWTDRKGKLGPSVCESTDRKGTLAFIIIRASSVLWAFKKTAMTIQSPLTILQFLNISGLHEIWFDVLKPPEELSNKNHNVRLKWNTTTQTR